MNNTLGLFQVLDGSSSRAGHGAPFWLLDAWSVSFYAPNRSQRPTEPRSRNTKGSSVHIHSGPLPSPSLLNPAFSLAALLAASAQRRLYIIDELPVCLQPNSMCLAPHE